jgi:hypothetical protein
MPGTCWGRGSAHRARLAIRSQTQDLYEMQGSGAAEPGSIEWLLASDAGARPRGSRESKWDGDLLGNHTVAPLGMLGIEVYLGRSRFRFSHLRPPSAGSFCRRCSVQAGAKKLESQAGLDAMEGYIRDALLSSQTQARRLMADAEPATPEASPKRRPPMSRVGWRVSVRRRAGAPGASSHPG